VSQSQRSSCRNDGERLSWSRREASDGIRTSPGWFGVRRGSWLRGSRCPARVARVNWPHRWDDSRKGTCRSPRSDPETPAKRLLLTDNCQCEEPKFFRTFTLHTSTIRPRSCVLLLCPAAQCWNLRSHPGQISLRECNATGSARWCGLLVISE
jgi:hypothetical protein